MTVSELLTALRSAGLKLALNGSDLRVIGRKEGLTSALRGELARHKATLVASLEAARAARPTPLPVIQPAPTARHAPFPLTDIQQAYWVGRRGFVPWGGVSTHYYGEFDCRDLDLGRLEASLNDLIRRHEALRIIIDDDGHQRVLSEVPPYRMAFSDLQESACAAQLETVAAIRDGMSHQVRATDIWPLFEIRATALSSAIVRLHVSVDLLIADFYSLALLAREWHRRYEGACEATDPSTLSIRDYVLARGSLTGAQPWHAARAYWQDRIGDMAPPPALPRAHHAENPPRFERWAGELDADRWKRIKAGAARLGISPSTVVLACFAEILATWTGTRRFTVTLTQFDRLPLHPQISDLAGDFTSALLADIDCRANLGFAEFAKECQLRLWNDLDHGLYSAVEVARDLRSGGAKGHDGLLFPVVFTSALPLGGDDLKGFEAFGEEVYSITQTPQVWLDHVVSQVDGGLRFRWDVRSGVYPAIMIDDMFRTFERLLRRLAVNDDWSCPLRVGPTDEDLAERAEANATERERSASLLHELFERSAEETPDAPAVISDTRTVTYRELRRAAHSVAARLSREGIAPGDRVIVIARSGWEQAAAALGALMAGAAFVPVSPTWPPSRQREVIEIADARWGLLGRGIERSPDEPSGFRGIQLDSIEDAPRPSIEVTPDGIAYLIFTSGSTGAPKGVVIEHRAATTTILDVNRRFGIGPLDRVLGLSEFTFDLAIWDLFGIFAAGGAVVAVEEEGHLRRNPERWYETMARQGVTVWNSVPQLMGMLVQHSENRGLPPLDRLRVVMLSGDWIPLDLPRRLRSLAPNARCLGLGGATEASIWSNWFEIGDVDPAWKSIPYGYPLANQRFHVLATDLSPCPRFVAGDLYIAGDALAREYWGRPDLTRSSFISHPATGERMYRTGDLGRYMPGGLLEFLGRRDQQVKVGGYRVELEEIETKLLSLPGITAAAACVRVAPGGAVIEAAVVCGDDVARTSRVAAELGGLLPAYMVPSRIVKVAEIPLSANGKVDRERLRVVLDNAGIASARSTRRSGLEGDMTAMLAKILGREEIDAECNFFELGATSLDLVRFHGALEQHLGSRIEPTLAFEYGNIRALASQLEHGKAAGDGIDGAARREGRLAHLALRRGAHARRRQEGSG